MKLFIYHAVPISIILSLFVIPLFYCSYKSFGAGFRFTWWTWAIVLFVFGLLNPYYCAIKEDISGTHIDSEGMIAAIGIIMGWLPGLLFASAGMFISKYICPPKKKIIYNKNFQAISR